MWIETEREKVKSKRKILKKEGGKSKRQSKKCERERDRVCEKIGERFINECVYLCIDTEVRFDTEQRVKEFAHHHFLFSFFFQVTMNKCNGRM